MNRYAAGIVLYNPDLKRLHDNLAAIAFQVKTVYCYNNGTENEKILLNVLNDFSNVRLIGCGKNNGIATALQSILEFADKDGFEWVLTLDQDSIMPLNSIEQYDRYTAINKAGMICPVMHDERRKNIKMQEYSNEIDEVTFCITSGAFTNVRAWKNVGGYDEKLFIGLVDNEFSYRMIKNDYKIIRINSLIMNHELGKLTPSKFENLYLKLGDIFHSETIKKLSYKREVSPMRFYYAVRNMVYLNRKYPKNSVEDWSTKTLLVDITSTFIRGKKKIKLLRVAIVALHDGVRMV